MTATARKLTRKEKDALSRKSAATAPKKGSKSPAAMYGWLAALLGFLLYANTIGHDYTLDDTPAITSNRYVQKGVSGIGDIIHTAYWSGYAEANTTLYRPVPLILFAVEWQFFPKNPAAGHFVNVLLFALTGLLLFRLLHTLLPGNLPAAWLTTLLFMAHPIHTEVVANIKSCDEILCLLFCILGLQSLLWYQATGKTASQFRSAGYFFLALLSKENAMTWLAVFPLALYVFRGMTAKDTLRSIWPHGAAAVIYLVILAGIQHGQLISDAKLTNQVMAGAGVATRLATAVYVLGAYVWQLLIPVHLSMDYSFAEIRRMSFADTSVWISFAVVAASLITGFLLARKRLGIGFAILFVFITLSIVSNIPFLVGTVRADRLLYTASLGSCMFIVLLLVRLLRAVPGSAQRPFASLQGNGKAMIIATAVLVFLFSARTVARNAVWKDNMTLFTAGLEDAPNSAYMHYLYANELLTKAHPDAAADSVHNDSIYRVAQEHYAQSVQIDPGYAAGYSELAATYRKRKMPDEALRYYAMALKYNPELPQAYNGMGVIYFEQKKYKEALGQFSHSVQLNSTDATTLRNLGSCYLLLGQSRNAIQVFEQALRYNPGDASVLQYMGFAYQDLGDAASANAWFEKARQAGAR